MKSLLLAASLGAWARRIAGSVYAGGPRRRCEQSLRQRRSQHDAGNNTGNNTGDSRVGALNRNQLNKNYQATWQLQTPSDGGLVVPAQTNLVAPTAPPPLPAPPGVVVK